MLTLSLCAAAGLLLLVSVCRDREVSGTFCAVGRRPCNTTDLPRQCYGQSPARPTAEAGRARRSDHLAWATVRAQTAERG